jgi:Flp pilus assembly pilin Flp
MSRVCWRSRSGQTIYDYALVVAFVALLVAAILVLFGDKVRNVFSTVNVAAVSSGAGEEGSVASGDLTSGGGAASSTSGGLSGQASSGGKASSGSNQGQGDEHGKSGHASSGSNRGQGDEQ